MILREDLFKVGKCYKMIRNKKEIKFKVYSYDQKMCCYNLVSEYSRFMLQQLEESDIETIQEIKQEKLGELAFFNDINPVFYQGSV